jgi:predicted Zn-dependent protease
LTAADFPAADEVLLKASPATAGETVSDFATRMGAADEIKTICLINDRSPGEILKEGEVIKWILRKPTAVR